MSINWKALANFIMPGAVVYLIAANGAGWWALLAVAYGMWEYADGVSRGLALSQEHLARATALLKKIEVRLMELRKEKEKA